MSTTPNSPGKSNFQIIQATRDGKIALIVVDVGLNPAQERERFPWLLKIELPIANPSELGLCDEQESNRLGDIEDTLLEGLDDRQYRYVGRVTWNGVREVLVYVADPDTVIQHLSQMLERTEREEIRVTKKHDPEWTVFDAHTV